MTKTLDEVCADVVSVIEDLDGEEFEGMLDDLAAINPFETDEADGAAKWSRGMVKLLQAAQDGAKHLNG
jgi:hypothetical protein